MTRDKRIVIIDTSDVADCAEYGGMLYELKLSGVCDGREFQIGNGGDLLMDFMTFQKCRTILQRHGAKPINT